MENWVNAVVNAHKEFEPPLSFWRWAALTSISAVVKDNIWIRQSMFDTYPNIYVMLHADSGMKKGPPVNFAKKLVKGVGNTKVISGRSSIQGILKKLGTSETRPGGLIIKGSSGFICSSELSSAIVADPAAMDILTDLYDRSYNADDWESLLKQETFNLKAPVVSMLSATNESHSTEFFGQKDIGGGFFARTFVIYETEENRSNSLLVPLETPIDTNKFIDYLKILSTLSGPFQSLGSLIETEFHTISITNPHTSRIEYFSEPGALYEEWYTQFKKDVKEIKDTTGTLNRFGTSVLKVAMLLSLGEHPKLIITPTAMTEAITICEKLVGNIRKITVGRNGNDATDGKRKTILLTELMKRDNFEISRAQLHKKYWMHGTVAEWDDAVISLTTANIIDIMPLGNQQIYKMKQEAIEDFTKHFAGKNK
jgi:hypothetical protein